MKNSLKRRLLHQENPAVIEGLFALTAEYPEAGSYIGDQILYATVGRDKHNLDETWVERTREHCEKMRRMFGTLEDQMYGRKP